MSSSSRLRPLGYRNGWVMLLLLLAAGCTGREQPEVRAVQGRLDLRHEALDEVLHLRGEWLARAGADSAAFREYDYDDSHWRTARVESYFREQGFPDEGLVWYRLHVRLPRNAPPLKGFLQHAENAHALYVATPGAPARLLAASGRPAASAATTILSRKPVSFSLPADTSFVLSWAVANYDYLHGGPFYAIQIGPADEIEGGMLRRTAMVFLCCGLYLMVAFFFLLHWATHRHDWQSLAVGSLAFVMSIRSVSVSGSLELLIGDSVGFALRIMIDAATYLVLNGLFAFLLWSFFPKEFGRVAVGPFAINPRHDGALPSERPEGRFPLPDRVRQANTIAAAFAMVTSAIFVAIAFLATPEVTSHAMSVARWISLALVVPTLVVIGAAALNRRLLAGSMAFGMALILVGGVHDVLLAIGIVKGNSYLITYTFAGFVLVQGYALARRNARNAWLVRRNADLLQQEVEDRTKELRAASIAAHAANLAKGQFLSAVSHELRTPLASILGYTEILQDEVGNELKAPQREFLSIIRVSAERLLALVNDLLDVAKIEAGRLSLDVDAIDVQIVVREAVQQAYPLARDKDLSLDAHVEQEAPFVRADGVRLRQVLINLLSNAIKFTERGGVTVRVREAMLGHAAALAIEVWDTGPGIAPDFLPHIFDRFTQEQRAYNRTQRGTGLGLTISRELVARMGGQLTVESREGQGSTFAILLPRAEVGAPARGKEPADTGAPVA